MSSKPKSAAVTMEKAMHAQDSYIIQARDHVPRSSSRAQPDARSPRETSWTTARSGHSCDNANVRATDPTVQKTKTSKLEQEPATKEDTN